MLYLLESYEEERTIWPFVEKWPMLQASFAYHYESNVQDEQLVVQQNEATLLGVFSNCREAHANCSVAYP